MQFPAVAVAPAGPVAAKESWAPGRVTSLAPAELLAGADVEDGMSDEELAAGGSVVAAAAGGVPGFFASGPAATAAPGGGSQEGSSSVDKSSSSEESSGSESSEEEGEVAARGDEQGEADCWSDVEFS